MTRVAFRRILAGPVCAMAMAACGERDGTAPLPPLPTPASVDVPAPPGGAQPHVAAAGDGFLVSWQAPLDSGSAVQFARWDGSGWSAPATIRTGRDFFVNWADFPSVIELTDGRMFAHWLQRSGEGRYAYDVRIAESADGGRTWSEGAAPHEDGTQSEHGFVSLFPHEAGVGAVWLDGRNTVGAGDGEHGGAMTLRFRPLGGPPEPDVELDARVCDCCQTGAAITSRGPLVAYRDRSNDEIRDIAVTRLDGDRWTAPRPLHADGWRIEGCPVNGPQLDARGSAVVAAWFTAAQDTPRVRVAFSADDGDSFGAPTRVDGGDPVGRVDVVLLDDDLALVTWLERVEGDGAVRARLVHRDGRLGEPATLGAVSAERPSGFPRMAVRGDRVLLAWTEATTPSRLRAVSLDVGGMRQHR